MLLSGKYKINGIITKGTYSTLYEGEHFIKKHKVAMQEKGFSSAFVIAFSNGERISIEKAIKLAEK